MDENDIDYDKLKKENDDMREFWLNMQMSWCTLCRKSTTYNKFGFTVCHECAEKKGVENG